MSNVPNFDPTCKAAVARAKNALPEGTALGIEQLAAAVYYESDLRTRFPDLAGLIPVPVEMRQTTEQIALAASLTPIMDDFYASGVYVTADRLFAALINSDAGRKWLNEHGLTDSQWQTLKSSLTPAATAAASATHGPWRTSPARREAVARLKPLGRMLTETELLDRGTAGADANVRDLVTILSRMRRRNAMIVGPPGTGKSALVYTLARRIVQEHESIPAQLRDYDIFELSPAFLRSGTMYSGQYEEKVSMLLAILQANPKIILFVDEVHSLLQSGVHARSIYSDTNESFKGALARGDITLIGCTTLTEYRALIAPDAALERRFSILKLEGATREATLEILRERRPKMEAHYSPLKISDRVLELVVDMSDEYLPARYQPDKALFLLDGACACATTAIPPAAEVAEEHIVEALEKTTGEKIVTTRSLTVAQLLKDLKDRIVGQDDVLERLASPFVAGLTDIAKSKKPRHVFFFGGPTGVGKTEVSRLLSQVLGGKIGGHRENLIRIDCNNLQGQAGESAHSIGWKLFGAPPGYLGYVRGEGGLLGRIRDKPESIVLFDEIEKADPALSRHLLRVLDEGQAEDSEGNRLDFRRAFFIFTSNAGCTYADPDRRSMVFTDTEVSSTPTCSEKSIQDDLRLSGYGEEFFYRVNTWLVFHGLTTESVETIVQNQLAGLKELVKQRGLGLQWDADLIAHLSTRWQPRFGVRHLTTILTNRLVEQLGVAEAQNELKGVSQVHLKLLKTPDSDSSDSAGRGATFAVRRREGDSLLIELA